MEKMMMTYQRKECKKDKAFSRVSSATINHRVYKHQQEEFWFVLGNCSLIYIYKYIYFKLQNFCLKCRDRMVDIER